MLFRAHSVPLRDGQAEAINVFASPILASLDREIITLAAEYRLPAIYQWREAVEAGGLLSYGADVGCSRAKDRRTCQSSNRLSWN